LILFVAFTTTNIPFGTFVPGLVIGSLLGRLYGELLHDVFGC